MNRIPKAHLILSSILAALLHSPVLAQDEFNFDDDRPGIRYINFGCFTGATGETGESYGVKFINGILIKNELALGFGLGFDKYSEFNMVPVFLDAKLFADLSERTSPYFFADLGYSLMSRDGLNDLEGEGFYGNAGAGLVFHRRGTHGITLDFGYRVQKTYVNWYRIYYYGNSGGYIGGSEPKYNGFFTVSLGLTI